MRIFSKLPNYGGWVVQFYDTDDPSDITILGILFTSDRKLSFNRINISLLHRRLPAMTTEEKVFHRLTDEN